MGCGCSGKSQPAPTGCVCTGPGFCQRHQCQKSAAFVKLCQTRQPYFDAWQRGEGPCLADQRPKFFGLGDALELLIQWITFGRLKPWPGCGCQRRKAWLNRIRLWQRRVTVN